MFEAGLSFFICLADGIAGSIYGDKFLRVKNQRNSKIILVVWAVLYFISQSVILERIDSAYPLNDFIKAIVDIAIILFLQIFLYQKDLSKQLFVAVSFVAGKKIIRYIIVVLASGLNYLCLGTFDVFWGAGLLSTVEEVERWEKVSGEMTWFLVILAYALLMFLYFSIISRKFVRKDYPLQKQENAFLMLPSVATLCISVTLKMLIVSVEKGVSITMFDKVPATMFWVPFICILLMGVNVSSVIIFQKLVHLNEEERKQSILENQVVQMQREIEEIQDIYSDMRGLKHDLKSHLESIAAIISQTSGPEREELDGYIGKMERTVNRLDFVYKTGNPITDVIIHQKKQEAEKQQITFRVDFTYPDKQQIDVYDIGVVLNNALENAIEACSKVTGEKMICLRSYSKGNLFFIEVENDFSGELVINSETGLPVSSKENRNLHGVGMGNIRRCAGKYKGDIDITVRDLGEDRKRFSLIIMMYEKCFTSEKP